MFQKEISMFYDVLFTIMSVPVLVSFLFNVKHSFFLRRHNTDNKSDLNFFFIAKETLYSLCIYGKKRFHQFVDQLVNWLHERINFIYSNTLLISENHKLDTSNGHNDNISWHRHWSNNVFLVNLLGNTLVWGKWHPNEWRTRTLRILISRDVTRSL
jgi:hypothetical protein